MPETTRASFGGCKHFECRVIGYPRPSITWWKDGRDITTDNRYEFDYSVDGTITMIISKVTQKDQGCYQCRAENSEGWAATAAYLHVRVIEGQREDELTTVHKMKFEFGGLKNQDEAMEPEDKNTMNTRYNDFIENIGGNLKNGSLVDDDFDMVKRRMIEKMEASMGGDDDSGLDGSVSTVGTDIGQVSDLWTRKGKNLENISEGIHSDSSIGSETGHDDSAFGPFDSNESSSNVDSLLIKRSSDRVGVEPNDSRKDSCRTTKDQKRNDDLSSDGTGDSPSRVKNITFKFDTIDDDEPGKHPAGGKTTKDEEALAIEEEEEDDVLDQLVDFIGAGKRLSRRPTDDSGFGDDDNWMDSSSDSEHGASDQLDGSTCKDRHRKTSADRRHKHQKADKLKGGEKKSDRKKQETKGTENTGNKLQKNDDVTGDTENRIKSDKNKMDFASVEDEPPMCPDAATPSEVGLDTNGNNARRKGEKDFVASGKSGIDNGEDGGRNGRITTVSDIDNNNDTDLISATSVQVEQSMCQNNDGSSTESSSKPLANNKDSRSELNNRGNDTPVGTEIGEANQANNKEGVTKHGWRKIGKEQNDDTEHGKGGPFGDESHGGYGRGTKRTEGSEDDLALNRNEGIKDHLYYPSRQPGKHDKDRWNDSEDDEDRNSRYNRRSQTYESGYDGDLESCRSSVLYSDDERADPRRDRSEDNFDAFKKGRRFRNFGHDDDHDKASLSPCRRTNYGEEKATPRSDVDDDLYSWKSRVSKEADSSSDINTTDFTTDFDDETFGYLRLSSNEKSDKDSERITDSKGRYSDQDENVDDKKDFTHKPCIEENETNGNNRKRHDLDQDLPHLRTGKETSDNDQKRDRERKQISNDDDENKDGDDKCKTDRRKYDDLDDNKNSAYQRKPRDSMKDLGDDKDVDDRYKKDRKKYDDLDYDKDSLYQRKPRDSKDSSDDNGNDKYKRDRKKYDELNEDKDSGYQRKLRDSMTDLGYDNVDDKYQRNRKIYDDLDNDKDVDDKYKRDRKKYDLDDGKDSGYQRKPRNPMKDLTDDNVDDKYKRDRKIYDDLDDGKDSGYQRKPRDSIKDLGDDKDVDDKYKRDRKKYDDLDNNEDSGYQRKPRDSLKDLADDNADDKYNKDRKKYDDLKDDKDLGYQRKPRDSMKDINEDIDDKYKMDRKKYDDLDDDKDSGYHRKPRESMKDLGDDNLDENYQRDRKKYGDLDDDKDLGYQRKPRDSKKDLGDGNLDGNYKRDGKKYDDLDDEKNSGYQRKPRDSKKDLGDDNLDGNYKRDGKKYDDLDDDKDSGYQRKPRDSMKDLADDNADDKYKRDRKKYDDLDYDNDSGYQRKQRDQMKDLGDDKDVDDKYKRDRKKYDDLEDDKDLGYQRKPRDSMKNLIDDKDDDKYKRDRKKYDDLDYDKDSGYQRKPRDSVKDLTDDKDVDDKYKRDRKKYDDLDYDNYSGYQRKPRDQMKDLGDDKDVDDKYKRDRKKYDDLEDDKDLGYQRKPRDQMKDLGDDKDVDDKYKRDRKKYDDLEDDKDLGYQRKPRDQMKDLGDDKDVDDKYKRDRKKYGDLDEDKDSGYQRKPRDPMEDLGDDKDVDDKYKRDRKIYDDLDDDKDSGYQRKPRDSIKDLGDDKDVDDKYKRDRKIYDDLDDDKDSGYQRKPRDSMKDLGDDKDVDDKYKRGRKEYDDLEDDKDLGYQRKPKNSMKDINDDVDDKYKRDRKKYDDLDENENSGYQRKPRDSMKDLIDDKDDDKYKKDRKKYDDLDKDNDSGYQRKPRDSMKDLGDDNFDENYKRDRKKYSDLDDNKDLGYQRKPRDSTKDLGVDKDVDDKYQRDRKKYDDLDDDKDADDKYKRDRKKYDVLDEDNYSGYQRKPRNTMKDLGNDKDVDDKYKRDKKKFDDLEDDKDLGYQRKPRELMKDLADDNVDDKYKKDRKKYDNLDDDKDVDDKYKRDRKKYDDLDEDNYSGYQRKPRNSMKDLGDDKDVDDKYKRDKKKYDDLQDDKDLGYQRKPRELMKDLADDNVDDKYKKDRKKYDDSDDDKDSGYHRKPRDSIKDFGDDKDVDDKYKRDRKIYDDLDDDKDSGYQRKPRDSMEDLGDDKDVDDKYKRGRKEYDDLEDDKDLGYHRNPKNSMKDINDDVDDKYKRDRKKYDDLDENENSGYQRKPRDSLKDLIDDKDDDKYKKGRKKYDDLDEDNDSGYQRKPRDSMKDLGDDSFDENYKRDRKKYSDLDDNKDLGYQRKPRDSTKDLGVDKDVDDKYQRDRKKYDDLDDDKDADDKYKRDRKKYDVLDEDNYSGYQRKPRNSMKDLGDDKDVDDKYKRDKKKFDDLEDDKDLGYQRKPRELMKDLADDNVDDKYKKDRKKYDDLDDDKDVDDKYKMDRKKYDDLDEDKNSGYQRKPRDPMEDINDKDVDGVNKKDKDFDDKYSRRLSKPKYGDDDDEYFGKNKTSDAASSENNNENMTKRRNNKTLPDVHVGEEKCADLMTDEQVGKSAGNADRRTPSPRRPESLPIEKIMPDVTDDMRNGKPEPEHYRKSSGQMMGSGKTDTMEDKLIQKAKEVTAEIKTLNDAWMTDDNKSSGEPSPLGRIEDTKPELSNTFFIGVIPSDLQTTEQDESRSDEIRGVDDRVGDLGQNKHALNTLPDRNAIRHAKARSGRQPESHTDEVESILNDDELHLVNTNQGHVGKLSTQKDSLLESAGQTGKIDTLVGYTYNEYDDDTPGSEGQNETTQDGIVGSDPRLVSKTKYGTPSLVDEMITDNDKDKSPDDIPGLHYGQAIAEDVPIKKRGVSVHFEDEMCEALDVLKPVDSEPERKTPSDNDTGLTNTDVLIDSELKETSKRPTDTDGLSFSTSADIKEGKDAQRPRILKASSDVTIYEGQNLEINWEIQGTPEPRMKIYKNGEPIELFDGMEIVQNDHKWTLSIPDVIRDDAGSYELHIMNKHGTDKSEVKVQVHRQTPRTLQMDLAAPELTSPQPTNTAVKDGDDLILKCSVQGFPPPQVLWLRYGEELSDGDDVEILEEKGDQCLIVWEARPEHSGHYICRAVNSQGSSEVKFDVDVQDWSIEEDNSCENDTKSSKPGKKEKSKTDQFQKDEPSELPKDQFGKKEMPKVSEKPNEKTQKPVVEEEVISSKTENVTECLPEAGDDDIEMSVSKKEDIPPKPAPKPKDKVRKPVVEEFIEEQAENLNANLPINGEEAILLTTLDKKDLAKASVKSEQGTEAGVVEDTIVDRADTLQQSSVVEQGSVSTVGNKENTIISVNSPEGSRTSSVENVENQDNKCTPFGEPESLSIKTVKDDKVPKVAAKPKLQSKTPVVEELLQDDSDRLKDRIPLGDAEQATVTTVKTETVPKVATKPTEKSKTLASVDGKKEDDLPSEKKVTTDKKNKDTNIDLGGKKDDLDRQEKQDTLDKLSKSLGMDDLDQGSLSLGELDDDNSKQSTCEVKGQHRNRYHGDTADLVDGDLDGEPMMPAIELHMSNSDEMCTKKYMVVASYHDTTNDVHLESGEVIELLNKMVPTHWLVRKLDDKQQACYVPAALLQSRRDTDARPTPEGMAKAISKSKQAVQDLVDTEEDYICDLRDLIENYHDPLQDGSKEEFPEKLLEKTGEIFGNLIDLYNFHNKDLLPELMACADNPNQVAEVFLDRRESLKQYLPFWAGREKADKDMNSEEIQAFLQSYSKHIGDPDNAFQDLLNRPVERIHEYINLLKNLMKYTSQAGGDCSQLMSVVQMLDDLCQEVDNIMLLDSVQGYQGNIHELGPVIRHESAKMWEGDPNNSEPREREVFLFGDSILLASALEQDEDGEPKKLQFERIIKLRNTDIDHDGFADSRRLEFWDLEDKVKDNSEPLFTLDTKSPYSKQAWVRAIKEAQTQLGVDNTANMPERRKIKTSKHKVVSSTPRKGSKVVRAEDVERDSPFDDFNILDTSTEAVGVQPEFDDGTSRPVFQMKLEKTVVEEGATAQMECVVAGIPPPKVLWLKNNRPLMATDRCRVIVDGDTNILEFPRARADDTAVYSARAMNVNGSTISTAELYVGDAQPSDLLKYREGIPDNEFRTPAYFFQMKNCQVEQGRLARFDCRVVAYPKPDIIWMKDGKVLTSGERYKLLNFNDEIYSLLIQSVETDDEGRYTCWAHNKYGEAMTEAYLNVLALQDNMDDDDMAPKFLTKFYDQTVTEGVPCDLQCMIAGKPQPSVQWLHNNSELMATPDIAIVNQANFCSLKIKEVSKSQAGKYACLLKNGLGEASCSAGITVIDKKIKGVPMLPKFLKKLCDVTAKTNEDFELEVVVVGEPKPKVTWQYNHKPISGSHRRMRKSHEGDVYRLTISDVRLEDDGKFTCKAGNSEGEVYCSCNLLVKESRIQLEPSEEPSFTQKDFDARYGCAPTFLKKMEEVSAQSGQSAKFECRIMGIPEPSVKWFKNGVPLTPGKKYWISQDSAGNCGLQVYDVTTGDEGIYTCTLTNPAGEISTNASLRIGKPKESMERDRASMGRRLSRDDMLDSTRAPTMPRDEPMLKSTRPDAVRLSWSPAPTSGLPKDARNIRYLVESKALPNADWKTIGDGVHSNTFMAKNLNPDKEYAFRVRAANQFGQSEPTQPARLERIKLDIDEPIEKRKVILPESKRPPSLPSTRPVITDYGQESVRLAWKPTPPPVTIKKPLPVSYRVEAQELPNTDWLPMASGLSTPSYYLPQLQDRHDYNIRVRAENKYGVSEPSEPLWLPRAHSFPGVPIRRPEIVEMEPEFVKLSWERVDVPPTALDEEPLTYMLEMQEPAVRDWREIARDIHEPHYTVRDLRPGNDYRFRVRSRSVAGPLSEPSPATSLYRTLATTRAPIDRLQLDDHEFDTEGINLSWNRVNIPPYHRDDEPLLYSVEMMEQPIDDWRPVVSGIPTQRFRVTDLAPDRDYKFRVRALSSYGISPPSYALPVSYRRPLPSPSRPLLDHTPRLLYDDTDSLALAWQPPTLDSTRPLRYRVQMQAPPSMDWRTMASDIPDTRYRISGLGPSRDYLFRVVPETSLGQLDPLPPVSLSSLPTPRTFHPSRPEILDIEPTSLGLSWKRPVVDMYTPLTYNIEMQEPPSLSWRNVHSGLTDTHYRVGGLQPSRDYMFRVVPVTASGQLEPLPPVSISSMPVIPRMQHLEPSMTEMGRDSIKLSWRPAEIPFYRRQPIPLHYTVEMRTLPSSEWIPVARRVKDTSYIVKGLNPKNDYEFRVKAETDYGCSSPTTPVIVRRKPVPVFPRREPIISNVSPDSIALSWQPASLPGHSTRIPVYQIEVQDPPSIGQWRPLTNNVSQTSYNVMGLRPDRDYLFRVRAKVDGALGEPTLPVYLMRRCGPPRMPTDHPYVHDIQPTSVRLQWRSVELSPRHTDYSPVTYRLEIQEGTRSDWVTLAGRIPHTDFHVTNLTPDQEYSFRVRAENKYGVSEPTNLVHIKRRAVAPTLPQDEPLLYDVGAGSITLSWRSAGIPSYNTSPVTYTIFAQESPSGVWAPMARRIPHTWYVLNGIRPDRDYTFRVQAENEFGVSRPTLPVRLFHTEYKAPIELPEIDEFDEKTSSVNLRWRPRSMTPFASEPLRYHVESWEPKKRVWRRLASDIPDTSYRVTGVSSNQENIFRVRAQTKAALSEPTYPISLSKYLFPIRRPQLHDLDSEAVRLSWSPYQYSRPRIPSLPHLPSVPRRYEVELRELGSSDWRSVATVPDTSYHYRGLRPRQDYQFRIRGISDQGPLDVYSSPVTLYRRTALPRVPLSRPEIMSVQDETVDLSWSRVDVPATQYDETPLTYIIESQQLPGYDWTPLARGIPDTSYRVTGLRRNQDYAFRIRGELPSGLSEPSPYVPVYRRPKLERIDTEWQKKHLKRVRKIDLKPPLATTHVVKNLASKPPMSPRSRREQFLQDSKKISAKIPVREKSYGFSNALEKFKKADVEKVHQPRIGIQEDDIRKSVRGSEFAITPSKTSLRKKYASDLDLSLSKFKIDKPDRPSLVNTDFHTPRLNMLKKAFDDSCSTIGRHHSRPSRITENAKKYVSSDYRRASSWHGFTRRYIPTGRSSSVTRDMSVSRSVRASFVDVMSGSYIPHRSQSCGVASYRDPSLSRIGLSWYHDRTSSNMPFARNRSASAYDNTRKSSVQPMNLERYSSTEYLTRRDNSSSRTRDTGRSTRGMSLPPSYTLNKYSSSEYLSKRDYSPSVDRDTRRSYRGMSQPPVSVSDRYSSESLSRRDHSSSLTRESSLPSTRGPKSYRSKSMSVVDGYIPMASSTNRNTYVPKTKCFRDSSPSTRLSSIPGTPPRRESSPFVSRGSPLLSRKGSVDALRHSVASDRASPRESSVLKTRHLTPQRLRTMSVSSSCGSLYDMTPPSSRAQSIISRSPSKDYTDALYNKDSPNWIRKVVSGFRKHIA